jgi:hypothetical protein
MNHVVALLLLLSYGYFLTKLVKTHAIRGLAVYFGYLVAVFETGQSRRRVGLDVFDVVLTFVYDVALVQLKAKHVRYDFGPDDYSSYYIRAATSHRITARIGHNLVDANTSI